MKKRNKGKNRQRDLKSARITTRMLPGDKLLIKKYGRENNMSYAAVIREALHEKFPEGFDPRNE